MAEENNSRESILNNIKEALANPVPLPFPGVDDASYGEIYPQSEEDLTLTFANEFNRIGGRFIFCESVQQLPALLRQLLADEKLEKVYFKDDFVGQILGNTSFKNLADSHVSITGCECLVARTGTMVLSSAGQAGRATSVYAPVHICIAFTPQLFFDLREALEFLQKKYGENLPSNISFATGPSRTADIEKTLVTGVHGPKVSYCILVETA